MEKTPEQVIVEKYIQAYNNFDVEGMLENLQENIVFENLSDGQQTLAITGIAAFRNQAEEATAYFKEREQRINSVRQQDHQVDVEIRYTGVLAMELPNGLQVGDTINLEGSSTFFFENGKIVKIVDQS